MKITIENVLPLPIAYIRRTGAYGTGNIEVMEQIKHWAQVNHLMNHNTVIFGIAYDNQQVTPPEQCRYDACIQLVDKGFRRDDSVQYGEIAGGKYAVLTIEHTAEAMGQAWSGLFPALAEMNYCFDPARPILERYASEKVMQHLCELCVPVL